MKNFENYYIGPTGIKNKIFEEIETGIQDILQNYMFKYNNSETRKSIIDSTNAFLNKYVVGGLISSDFNVEDGDLYIPEIHDLSTYYNDAETERYITADAVNKALKETHYDWVTQLELFYGECTLQELKNKLENELS